MQPPVEELSDEELMAVADDPSLKAKLTPQERGRLSALMSGDQKPQATEPGSAAGRFINGVWQNVNPMNTVHLMETMAQGPSVAMSQILAPSGERIDKAKLAAEQGRPADAVGNVLAAIPMVGPPVGAAIDKMRSGDIAGGAGEMTGIVAPFAAGPLVRGAGAALKGTGVGEAIANAADASANSRMVDQMVPKVGPNKVRLGNRAADVAPKLLRDPDLSAYSRSGLAAKISDKLDAATEGLDATSDARLVSQQVQTGPLLKALDESIAELTATPVDASKLKPGGSGASKEDFHGTPLGQSVEPAPNAAQIATLRQMRKEVAALGPTAPFESVRRIRQAWDQVARVKYSPAVSADYLAKQGEATGASKGTGAIRESLADADPATAKANDTYHLYKTANDVVQAAEEASRVRPNRGRGMMARATGAMIGAKEGGAPGAIIGAIVAQIADRAAEMAPTFQIAIARRLAAVADALRAGNPVEAQAIVDRTIAKFPTVKSGLKITGKMTPAMGGQLDRVPLAAQEDPTRR
jgi:hypothetical protein